MNSFDQLDVSLGRITAHVEVAELVVRLVKERGLTEELDGGLDVDNPDQPSFEYRLQGRIVNICKQQLKSPVECRLRD